MIENTGGAAGASRAISVAKALLISARPWQWYKNLVIYLAFFFTINEAWMPGGDARAALTLFVEITLAFAAFSVLTSAVYLVNDVLDAERDRLHPQKRNRPVASGRLPVSVAWTAAALAAIVGLGGSFALDPLFGVVSCAYALANAAYSLLLKHIVLVDVFVISSGMVLRAVAGAVIMQAPISPWLYLCTALVALLLALVKRRTQLASAGENAARQRATLSRYTAASLDQLIVITATASLIAYSLYTFTAPNLPANNAMMITIPFVAFGLFRYILLAATSEHGENPERLLIGDRALMLALLLWIASAVAVLAMFRA